MHRKFSANEKNGGCGRKKHRAAALTLAAAACIIRINDLSPDAERRRGMTNSKTRSIPLCRRSLLRIVLKSPVRRLFVFSLVFASVFGGLAAAKRISSAEAVLSLLAAAAVFAAVAFTAVQFMYLETQVFVTRLNGVYGTFAAIPLFMIWLNISWNIILMGAELSYAFQNVDTYNLED